MVQKTGRIIVGTVITEKEYTTLKLMLNSNDSADHEVARQVLNGCDSQKSIYWIWKLLYRNWSVSRNIVNLHTKASRELRDDCGIFQLVILDSEHFASWLIGKGWMTKEIFNRLKEDILALIADRAKNGFFDIYATINKKHKALDASPVQGLIFKSDEK